MQGGTRGVGYYFGLSDDGGYLSTHIPNGTSTIYDNVTLSHLSEIIEPPSGNSTGGVFIDGLGQAVYIGLTPTYSGNSIRKFNLYDGATNTTGQPVVVGETVHQIEGSEAGRIMAAIYAGDAPALGVNFEVFDLDSGAMLYSEAVETLGDGPQKGSLSVAKNGSLIAFCGRTTWEVYVYKLPGFTKNVLPNYGTAGSASAFSPDGSLLAVGYSDRIRIFETTTLTLTKTIVPNPASTCTSVSWDASGDLLAAAFPASGGKIVVYNAAEDYAVHQELTGMPVANKPTIKFSNI